ncbi:unnamed protein product, partial [Mesorhabditis spiculigera]
MTDRNDDDHLTMRPSVKVKKLLRSTDEFGAVLDIIRNKLLQTNIVVHSNNITILYSLIQLGCRGMNMTTEQPATATSSRIRWQLVRRRTAGSSTPDMQIAGEFDIDPDAEDLARAVFAVVVYMITLPSHASRNLDFAGSIARGFFKSLFTLLEPLSLTVWPPT